MWRCAFVQMRQIDTEKPKSIYIKRFIVVYMVAEESQKKSKLVNDVDDGIWKQFTGWCKGQDVLVGVKLSEILRKFMKNPK